jgi:hypothetical protein
MRSRGYSAYFPLIGRVLGDKPYRGPQYPMTACDQEEYSALRATIRERGTARIAIFAGGFVAWGVLAVATAALASTPLATLLPLLVLGAVFEAVYALHIGVERIGRYLQVFHETGDPERPRGTPRGWESVAMVFGRPKGTPTPDALFTALFLLATVFNVAPIVIVEPTLPEIIFVGGAHALFIVRVAAARAAAQAQRAIDLRRFEELKRGVI